jgi:hypothetical protein
MSIDQQPSKNTPAIEAVTQEQELKRSAENYLIGLGYAVHLARKQGLEFDSLYDNGDTIVYVATPSETAGIIRVRIIDGVETFSLRPSVENGLYSRSSETNYERIEAIEHASELKVKIYGYPKTSTFVSRRETVNDPARARVLEAFAGALKPITPERFSSILDAQSKQQRAQNKEGIGKRIGRFIGRKDSH